MRAFLALGAVTSAIVAPCAVAADVDPSEVPYSQGFHNLFVMSVMAFLCAWIAKVAYQICTAHDLNKRLQSNQSLQLENMSIYAQDFQILIRQHFNQILRIRRTVPAMPVQRLALSVHVRPESMRTWFGEGGRAAGSTLCGVQFEVDTLAQCSIQLFWGVPVRACNEVIQRLRGDGDSAESRNGGRRNGGQGQGRGQTRRQQSGTPDSAARSLLEMEEMSDAAAGPRRGTGQAVESETPFPVTQFAARSREFFLPAGLSQRYVTPAGDLVDTSRFPFDMTMASVTEENGVLDDNALVPLVIVVTAQKRDLEELGSVQEAPVTEAYSEISFVKFKRGDGGALWPELMQSKQLAISERNVHEIQGIFGFEDDGEAECVICIARPKNVLLFPCRHCAVCHSCLRQIRDEKCSLCRSTWSSYITLPGPPPRRPQSPQRPQSDNPHDRPPSGDDPGAPPPPGGGSSSPGGGNSLSSRGGGNSPSSRDESKSSRPTSGIADGSGSSAASAPTESGGSSGQTRNSTSRDNPGRPPRPEAPATRPRGVQVVPKSSQGIRSPTGRARFADRTEVPDAAPLLAQETGGRTWEEDRRLDRGPLASDETRVLIRGRDIV